MKRRLLSISIIAAIILASSFYAVGMSPPVYTDKVDKIDPSTDDSIVRSDGVAGDIKDGPEFIAEQNVAETATRIIVTGDTTYPHAAFDSRAFNSSSISGYFANIAGAGAGVWELFVGFFGPSGENHILNYGDRPLRIASVDQAAGKNSQLIVITTGVAAEDNTGSDDSGLITIVTGEVKTGGSGESGFLNLLTGATDSGYSGGITMSTGDSASGYSGGITITTGDSGSLRSGDLLLTTGAAGGTRGDVIVDSPQWSVDADGVILGYEALRTEVATPYLATLDDKFIIVNVAGSRS